MKSTQQQAKEMFFQQDMSKTAIADKLGVSRRTIYQWSIDGDWDTLKQHARTMPLMLTERVYYVIDLLTTQMLTAHEGIAPTITTQQVNMLAKLTNIITKLRKGSTLNEDMETFQVFLDRVSNYDDSLAEEIKPHIEDYIFDRRRLSKDQLILTGHNPNGTIKPNDNKHAEKLADEAEQQKITESFSKQTSAAEASSKEAPQPTQQSDSPFRGAGGTGSKREVPPYKFDPQIATLVAKAISHPQSMQSSGSPFRRPGGKPRVNVGSKREAA